MVAPVIKTPKKYSATQTVQFEQLLEQDGYKQAPPYTIVTAYNSRRAFNVRAGNGSTVSIIWDWWSQIDGWDSSTSLNNRVYSKLKGKLQDPSQLGASILEWRESYDMIARRSGQLVQAARAVRRFQFDKAAKILRMAARPKGVSRHRSFGANWLEYWFGWSALIGDIYSAVDVLQQPPIPQAIKASVVESKSYTLNETHINSPNSSYPSFSFREQWTKWHVAQRGMACGCKVLLSDENAYLANQLGLSNPLAIAWEGVPFSWLLDWVANVGDVLEGFTDFHGLTLSEAWTTRFVRGSLDYYDFGTYWWWEGSPPHKVYGGGFRGSAKGSFSQVVRSLGLPSPILSLNRIHLSKSRAATAISLLLGELRR